MTRQNSNGNIFRKNRVTKLRGSKTLSVENLETRELLAANIVNNAGTVEIRGGNTSEKVEVRYHSTRPWNVQVWVDGKYQKQWNYRDFKKVVYRGNGGNDTFKNMTRVPSYADGGSGNDTLYGGSRNDDLFGGAGNDTLYGGDGNDKMRGNSGHDKLYGDAGNDSIWGWTGNDWLNGGDGNDRLYGHDGDDGLYGSNGNDFLYGENGNDTLSGRSGDDEMFGGAGNDKLYGGDGNDRMRGNSGHDKLYGDAGNDWIWGWTGNDWLNGGDGNDHLYGHDGDDGLYGANGNDFLYGEDGNDTLKGRNGDDRMFGGAGNDKLHADGGNDTIDVGPGIDTIFQNGRALLRPTLLVTIHGANFGNNDTGEGQQRWEETVARGLEQRLEEGGSQTYTTRLEWHGNMANDTARKKGVSEIEKFLRNRNQPWDVVLVGHSRGGVLAAAIANELKGSRNLDKTHLIMLDPTAAIPMGDEPIVQVGGHVDYAVNYDDGQDFLGGVLEVTMDSASVSGAKNIETGTAGISSHMAIANAWYGDSRYIGLDANAILADKNMADSVAVRDNNQNLRLDEWNGVDAVDFVFDDQWNAQKPGWSAVLLNGHFYVHDGQLYAGLGTPMGGAAVEVGDDGIGYSHTNIGGGLIGMDGGSYGRIGKDGATVGGNIAGTAISGSVDSDGLSVDISSPIGGGKVSVSF